MRPSVDELPRDLAMIVSSCWRENPNDRPDFTEIIQMLLHYLSAIHPPDRPLPPPRSFSSDNVVFPPESPGTSALMSSTEGSPPKGRPGTRQRGFYFCFNRCYGSPEENRRDGQA
ncbi:hypothetical protein MLD38_024463 [Melastoma candidum]|nr:hypothetical protein MLD38_024463 [Melastoma candidum]